MTSIQASWARSITATLTALALTWAFVGCGNGECLDDGPQQGGDACGQCSYDSTACQEKCADPEDACSRRCSDAYDSCFYANCHVCG